jgi:3-deoxy-D-manno-octulosonic-acid transferase
MIRGASLFNDKARLWLSGRRGIFSKLANDLKGNPRVVWFHAASLGEFEQGRPVIETFRENHPGIRILLTFFSPSGYEVKKNYEGADYVYYLPIDCRRNARRFITLVNPVAALFIKYEFWFNYLDQLHKRNIPIYVFSSIFRPRQHFFRFYGGWSRRQLKKITTFFVQDENSRKLLESVGITRVIVSGDTRFDRVSGIASQKKEYPLIEQFTRDYRVLLAGSSWPPDERLVLSLLKSSDHKLRVIIAPHEVHEERIRSILKEFADYSPVLYSRAGQQDLSASRVLVIDGIGYLSNLYQYCDIAWIGGGFGKGIHNILEAVTFGKPVLFGPNHEKFAEALRLKEQEGAFAVDEKNFREKVFRLLDDHAFYQKASLTCKKFIAENTGATRTIMENVKF